MGQANSATLTANKNISKKEMLQRIDKLFINRQTNNSLSECSDTLNWVDQNITKISLPRTNANILAGGASQVNVNTVNNAQVSDNYQTLSSEFPELNKLRDYLRSNVVQATNIQAGGECGCDGTKSDKQSGGQSIGLSATSSMQEIQIGGKTKKSSHKKHKKSKHGRKQKRTTRVVTDDSSSSDSDSDSDIDSISGSSSSDSDSSSDDVFEMGVTSHNNSNVNIVPFYSSESENFNHLQKH